MAWRSRALDVLTMAAELGWLYVIFALVSAVFGVGRSAVSLPLALATAASGFFEAPWVASIQIPQGPARALGIVVAAATIYVVMGFQGAEGLVVFRAGWPVEAVSGSPLTRMLVLGTPGAVLFWWSGARLGLGSDRGYSLPRTFRLGLPVVVFGAVAGTLIPVELGIMPAVYLFFGTALTGFAVSRVVSLELRGRAIGGAWGRILVGTLALVLGGSLLLAGLSESGAGQVVAVVLGLLVAILRAGLLVLAWIGGWLAELVLNLLSPIFGDGFKAVMERMSETLQEVGKWEPREASNDVPGWIPFVLKWGAISLAMAGAVALLMRLFRARQGAAARRTDEERQRLRDQGSVLSDMAALMGHLLGRVASEGQRAVRSALGLEGLLGATYRLYFNFLLLARRRGIARGSAETPWEFQRRVVDRLPAEETAVLTEAFSRARYGGHPPSREGLAELEGAWERVQAALGEGPQEAPPPPESPSPS